MEITFLGTSAGVPSKERGMPSIAVRAKELFLFDCGEGTQRQMMKFKVPYGSIQAIFLSHLHLDHVLGIYGLIETYRLLLPHRKLIIFAPKGFESKSSNVEIQSIKPGKLYENNEYEIHAFEVKHKGECYGFKLIEKDKIKCYEKKAHSLGLKGAMFKEIQKKGSITINNKKVKLKDITWVKKGKSIVYTGDTAPCNEIIKASKHADLLIHESSFLSDYQENAKEAKHTTVEDAAKSAKRSKVTKLILTHISQRYKDSNLLEKEAKKIFKNTTIAKDGECIIL